MQDTMGELWVQTHIATTFWYNILCILSLITRKLQSYVDVLHIELLLYYRRCIFSLLGLDVRYELWVTLPKTHYSLSTSHFCIYSVLRHITLKLQVICGRSAYWTAAIISETFFVWFRVALDIRLNSYGLRHALVILWYNIVCVYCKSLHTATKQRLYC